MQHHRVFLAALLTLAPWTGLATKQDCSFELPTGTTYNLLSLGTIKGTDRVPWSYFFDPCKPIDGKQTGESCLFPPTSALQVSNGFCYTLGALPSRKVAELSNAGGELLGLSLTFSGGEFCEPIKAGRSAELRVLCRDVPKPVVVGGVSEPSTCSYLAIVEARAGCPMHCPRDPKTGAVCGGRERGSCGPTSCACSPGHSGPLCAADGSDAGNFSHSGPQEASAPALPAGGTTAHASGALDMEGLVAYAVVPLFIICLGIIVLQLAQSKCPSALSTLQRLRSGSILIGALYFYILAMDAKLPTLGLGINPAVTSVAFEAQGAPPTGANCTGGKGPGDSEGPLLVMYGDLERAFL
jgi:hypothetical protein